MNGVLAAFWSLEPPELFQRLQTTPKGLTSEEASRRLMRFGANRLKAKKRSDAPSLMGHMKAMCGGWEEIPATDAQR